MTRKKTTQTTKTPSAPRTSVTLPSDLYGTLQSIARQKKVSLAWVIRDAAEKYVADLWPLLSHEVQQK